MHITFTTQAAAAIDQRLEAGQAAILKLVYDNEGCGCAVSGVPTLWIESAPQPNDFQVEATGLQHAVWVDKKHEIYFEERMTVDYKNEGRAFVLKSSGQIYNAYMSLIDKRS
ncbi:iron-sulfur cluster biosynthesis family protein [Paenibacillus puerhi]|uniref:iron-sulfur cluster biosynthesis family protein n=1 Tax=Paenibacillus puerhi TaxID=2692622 RepID=UPI00135B7D70|nr:iron-sulfur cluster biosynthesis family protein [Paenibacillus puerhi]